MELWQSNIHKVLPQLSHWEPSSTWNVLLSLKKALEMCLMNWSEQHFILYQSPKGRKVAICYRPGMVNLYCATDKIKLVVMKNRADNDLKILISNYHTFS